MLNFFKEYLKKNIQYQNLKNILSKKIIAEKDEREIAIEFKTNKTVKAVLSTAHNIDKCLNKFYFGF